MAKAKTRRNDAVTSPMPVLVPVDGERPDGHVLFQEGRATKFQPVKFFTQEPREKFSKRFGAVAHLISLATGEDIDYDIFKGGFRTLVETVYGQPLTDAVSKRIWDQPGPWSKQWLPALFNEETKLARFVMWWPDRKPVPAIYCPSREAALFVSLLLGRKITACLGCGVPFEPARPDQRYHDYHCAVRHRMARYRKRKLKKGKRNAKK